MSQAIRTQQECEHPEWRYGAAPAGLVRRCRRCGHEPEGWPGGTIPLGEGRW
jgi:hypothetical protein